MIIPEAQADHLLPFVKSTYCDAMRPSPQKCEKRDITRFFLITSFSFTLLSFFVLLK